MSSSSQFGRYEVEEEVARGGMGVIYRVRDPKMRRFLAMKVLLPRDEQKDESGSRHSKLSARFVDEAQLTGQLDHPGIIPVYDMARGEDGPLFFTMRLVKGRTLAEIFDLVPDAKDGWSVTRALGVLQKVCEAMGFAHERGVIHRDLKPSNVMVGRFGETYVMDWGLAKLVDEEGVADPAHEAQLRTVLTSARKDESSRGGELDTHQGEVMGTPAYMAPEQARGEVDRVDARSDIYSVGAMLYHLLTGHPPYKPAGESASGQVVLERLLAGPPAAVEDESVGVPAELAAICERAMSRDPEMRYASMVAVAEDLQAYVENRVVQAYGRGAVLEFKKWVQRNRTIAASLAALIVLVIAGLTAVSYVQTRARGEVEQKNRELAAKNVELESERKRTDEARDLAELNRARAVENEKTALANEQEALWQSYVGNIVAAHAEMEGGSASGARRRLAACSELLRGWEWRYLDQRADGSLGVLAGSETFVYALAVDPFSSHVAAAGGMLGDSGSPDYAIRIWDFDSGRLEAVLAGHETTVASLAYSPAGDVLASSDSGGTMRLWDVQSGALLAEARIGSRIDYHPDGRWIVGSSFADGGTTLWDTYDLAVVATGALPAGTNAVRCSPDGQSIAVAGRDHHIRILNLELETRLDLDASGEALEADEIGVSLMGPGVYALDFSPDGSQLVSGSGDGFVRIWDVKTGQRMRLLSGHRSIVHAVRWHPRFPWIVSSDASGSIRFWDATTGRSLDVLRGHDEEVYALGFSTLGDRLLSASRDRTVRVWDGQAGANDTLLDGLRYPNFGPYRLAFAPDSERIVWRSGGQSFSVTDVRTGEDLCSFWTLNEFSIVALHFSDDEVWECSAQGRLSVWNPTTGERISAVEVGPYAAACAFLPGDRAAIVATAPGLQRVDLTSGTVHWTKELGAFVSGLSVSADGARCLVESRAPEPRLACLETSTGAVLWELPDLPDLHDMEFFPDGKRFAHTTYNVWDDALFIRSAETGALLSTLIGHAQPSVLGISPDGARVVTGNWDGTISLWHPEHGEILALPAHSRHATQVGFSPDGQTIASLGDDGRRRLWSATSVESRQAARSAAAGRRRWSVDARRRVDELLQTRVHRAAVIEALEADPSLRPEQRDAAILLARSASPSPDALAERAVTIVMDPGRTGAEYMAAMEGARLAFDIAPNVADLASFPPATRTAVAPRVSCLYWAIALAQVRLGLPREGLVSLERADEALAAGVSWVSPPIPLIRAMAHHALGEAEAAAGEYERGSEELRFRNPLWLPGTEEVGRALEREVKTLLGRD